MSEADSPSASSPRLHLFALIHKPELKYKIVHSSQHDCRQTNQPVCFQRVKATAINHNYRSNLQEKLHQYSLLLELKQNKTTNHNTETVTTLPEGQ